MPLKSRAESLAIESIRIKSIRYNLEVALHVCKPGKRLVNSTSHNPLRVSGLCNLRCVWKSRYKSFFFEQSLYILRDAFFEGGLFFSGLGLMFASALPVI